MRDVCDRAEKVGVLERVKELVGTPKGLWDSRKRMCKIEDEFNTLGQQGAESPQIISPSP